MNCDKITNEKDDVALTYIRPNKAKEKLYDKTFFSYYKPHKKLFAFDIVCSLMIAACNMFYPFVAKT